MITLNDIEVLIHYYVSSSEHPRFDAPAVQEALHKWIENGCLQWDEINRTYGTTDRGTAHITQLRCLTLPHVEERWVDAHGEII